MNPRVLELIKNPKNIQLEDLGLLKDEIHAFPYIQNIRALHLYGVHLYEKESYQKELSTTAAYTTDKKILYQLINGKIQQEAKQEEVVEDKSPSKTTEKPVRYNYKDKGFPIKREETAPEITDEQASCNLQVAQDIKPVFVNGERNRILFEGEENFLDEENTETIDLESTLESGTLVTQKTEKTVGEPIQNQEESKEEQKEIEENAGENFTPETIIDEDQISSENVAEKVEEDHHLSFEEIQPLSEENADENTADQSVENEIITENEEASQEPETIEPEENLVEQSIEAEPISEIQEFSDTKVEGKEETESEVDAELSFHGTDAFLPDVKIQANNEEVTESAEVTLPNVNKHEEEMRRLIEEVEKKMKETKAEAALEEKKDEPQAAVEDHEISFAETQSFHFWSAGEETPVPSEEVKTEAGQEESAEPVKTVEEPSDVVAVEENTPEVQTSWKPMSLESNMPDSLISKSVAVPAENASIEVEKPVSEVKTPVNDSETEIITENSTDDSLPSEEEAKDSVEEQPESNDNSEEKEEVIAAKKDEEAPVMNVSFFSTDIANLRVEKQADNKEISAKEETKDVVENKAQSPVDSNVPGFINTWQSWLKIDRTEDVEKEKEEIKEKAIETFIENNPRISQLKEESTYVVKEKNDDISHLMTETLANLYFEQKLYSKAIKAFEILIKKHPEKKEYFTSKIKEIKDFRSKN